LNFYFGNTNPPALLTFDRGSRWTAYNWETNASNAGSDYHYQNDNYLGSSNVPGESVRSFIAQDQTQGIASLMTVQLQGLVAGDENGPVSVTNPPDLTRFKTVVDKKSTVSSAPFTTTPVTTDANVYMDEFLWTVNQKLPGIFAANPAQPTFVSLDNEPELWNTTHLEVQGPNPVTSDNYIAKTITLTKALKDQFPNVMIFGPVHYGFEGIYGWQGELSATPSGTNWFPDRYLPAIKTASTTYGKPLVDVYDFHWYSEATDGSGNRVTLSADPCSRMLRCRPSCRGTPCTRRTPGLRTACSEGRFTSSAACRPRLPLKTPAMKIAITEYNNGGGQHIAGTIAQADNLGWRARRFCRDILAAERQ
jgi:hypothetical protein